MSKEMREQINKVKNWKPSLNESMEGDEQSPKSYTIEVLPKLWQDLGIKRPAFSGGDEAGMSLLNRDNTIELTLGDEPVPFYRKDASIYNDKGQKAGRGDDSLFYKIKIYKSHGLDTKKNNILKYSLDAQYDKDAMLGGNSNLKPIGGGDFKSDEVGEVDDRGYFKIVAVE
jgi:hypothetical protein